MNKKLTALIIMDGYGLSKNAEGNAIGVHCSPYVNYLQKTYPCTTLSASGERVGLPKGQMGNSEVGHLNIGAGRVVYQDLLRISNSIKSKEFFSNQVLVDACQKAKGHALHLFGLVSDGGVHSHLTHIFALLKLAKQQGVEKCFVHAFMDGRDTSPTGGAQYVAQLQEQMDKLNFGKIATVCGRYYAMDRDKHWERIEQAYDMLTLGKGKTADSAVKALTDSYAENITDEFVLPTVIVENGAPVATIANEDTIIFFNFRPDRAREITRAFTQPDFNGFDISGKQRKVNYATMTNYDETFTLPIAFPDIHIDNTLGEYLSSCGLSQLRIAETEKYAHVTFFFNGGVEAPNEGETRVLIDSPRVATYDLQPEMSANLVTSRAIAEISKDKYDVMILNFANCDMVGHTGVICATCKAVDTVDNDVRLIVEYILQNDGTVFVTADHGNAEKLLENGQPFTAHTTNPVPFIMVSRHTNGISLAKGGALCDIAPTMLESMGLPKPPQMTGQSLICKEE